MAAFRSSFLLDPSAEIRYHYSMKVILFLSAVLMLAGCNTMQGLGEDIRGAGAAIERAAE